MPDLPLIIEPDADEPEAASVYIEGRIDDRPYRFLLDTGAAKSSIPVDAYTASLPVVGKNASSGVFAPSDDDVIEVALLEVGDLARSDFRLSRTPERVGATPLIGMDFLSSFCCEFSFDQQRVIVMDTPSGRPEHAEPLLMDQRLHPYVIPQLGRYQAHAVWDTGASLTIVEAGFIRDHSEFFQDAGFSTGTDATGAQVETPMYLMTDFTLAGYSFPSHRVAAVDLSYVNAHIEIPMDFILGYSTLRFADWWFDFPGKVWAITRWLAD